MKKIPSIFIRDWQNNPNLVTHDIDPQCQWVFDGMGIASRKFDGTCVLIDPMVGEEGLAYFKRYDHKKPKNPVPLGFIPAMERDEKTGHQTGWIPIIEGDPASRWHLDALAVQDISLAEVADYYPTGTYELCGPKVQGNPEDFTEHVLVRHGVDLIQLTQPITYESLFEDFYLRFNDIEGIVWQHKDDPDRMAKIKVKDFGLERN